MLPFFVVVHLFLLCVRVALQATGTKLATLFSMSTFLRVQFLGIQGEGATDPSWQEGIISLFKSMSVLGCCVSGD